MTGSILGRSPNLWLGAFVAVWNVAALIFTIPPTISAGVSAAAGAVILLIAGNDRLQQDAAAAKALPPVD